MSSARFYAHSLPGEPEDRWEPLEDHLHNVAALAREFAAKWNAADWGHLAGLWHDLGKYSRDFQEYLSQATGEEAHLEGLPGKVDHSSAGAQHAARTLGPAGRSLAYCIAGHHSGLLDAEASGTEASLRNRLGKPVPDFSCVPSELLTSQVLPRPRTTGGVNGYEKMARLEVGNFEPRRNMLLYKQLRECFNPHSRWERKMGLTNPYQIWRMPPSSSF